MYLLAGLLCRLGVRFTQRRTLLTPRITIDTGHPWLVASAFRDGRMGHLSSAVFSDGFR